jgi:hypothetical protein
MEGALDPELLSVALGDHSALPSPGELATRLADAELALLVQREGFPHELLNLAWYLHAVAASKHATRRYGVERQRAAFRVSEHILDLALRASDLTPHERLKLTFAAQIAALRGDANPNAIATYSREARPLQSPLDLVTVTSDISLSLAVALLGVDVHYVYESTDILRSQASRLATDWGVTSVLDTPFAPPAMVSQSVRDIMSFLVYGRAPALIRATENLRTVVTDSSYAHDRISQWVAAHLLNLITDLRSSSIWGLIPPEIPPSVAKAFALGYPRIVTMWPPQIDFLAPDLDFTHRPFNAEIRRLFLSTPTSSGKTLIAQLLIAAHIATQGTAVCYVAPTRALCREVASSLDGRMRYLGTSISQSLPDGAWLDDLPNQGSAIEVMTPERLSYMLRTSPDLTLQRFGMFVFDEVHTVAERGRGWTLEGEIAFLNSATLNTDHRIAILSAAIGNKAHFVQWLSPEGAATFHRHSPWRGTRRVTAIWTTWPDWESSVIEATRSAKYPERLRCPLYGRLDTRLGPSGRIVSLRTADPVGELVLRRRPGEPDSKDSRLSTALYRTLDPLVFHLAQSGPVLIIESTRSLTVSLARHLAGRRRPVAHPSAGLLTLREMVRARLGDEHPLAAILPKGIAFHHGGLSPDIRAAIEDAVAQGDIAMLVATTTMTEGVNLPVRSVVVASQGTYTRDGYTEYITGPRLINAIGRAGRATKETEGVVVLAMSRSPSSDDFDRLSSSEDTSLVLSTIATQEALSVLARFEEEQRLTEDAILAFSAPPVSDFISFVWFTAFAIEASGSAPTEDAVLDGLRMTLAWQQLPEPDRDRWASVALATLKTYRATSSPSRVRWPTAGTTIGSARTLEQIAKDIVPVVAQLSPLSSPTEFILAILGERELGLILSLAEAPSIKVYNRRGSPRDEIDVDLRHLIQDWLAGRELGMIATEHLSEIHPVDFRYEQLADLTNQIFEVFLPWILGSLTAWSNELLEEQGSPLRLPRSLPAYLRWGVGNHAALQLMAAGLYSRTLATRAALAWISADAPGDILDWLRSMDLREWRLDLSASISEIRQLLELVRSRPEGLAYRLITDGSASVKVRPRQFESPAVPVHLRQEEPDQLSTLVVVRGDEVLAEILTQDHSDLQSIMDSGLPVDAYFHSTEGEGILQLTLNEFD